MKTPEVTSHDGKSLKAKTRKGNHIMKNRNIQFKATAGVLIPLLLACLATVFISAPPNITYIGTFHWFAANGDEISGTFDGYLSPTGTPGVYDNHEVSDVTGGTGRFTSATGHWDSGGQIDVTTEPLSFSLPVQGWISSVGSTRR